MKLGARIFICFFVIFAACFYYPFDWIKDNIRIRYLEGVEDPLVDQAVLMAEMAAMELTQGEHLTRKNGINGFKIPRPGRCPPRFTGSPRPAWMSGST